MRVAVPSTDNDFRILRLVSGQTQVDDATRQKLQRKVAAHVAHDAANIDSGTLDGIMNDSDYSPTAFMHAAMQNGVSLVFDASKPERHISFWDYGEIVDAASVAGFEICIPFYRGASLTKPFLNLNIFDTTEPHISLYAELLK